MSSQPSLRARPDGADNRKLAEEEELRMASEKFPLIETTTLALDRHKRPLAAYFSYHYGENGNKIFDNVKVCIWFYLYCAF